MVDVVNTRMRAEELAALDALVDSGRYKSRTEAIRDAVARLVRGIAEQELVESHRLAYSTNPDVTDEIAVRRSRRAMQAMIDTDS